MKYEGLCIGGPSDREYLTSVDPYVIVPIRPTMPPVTFREDDTDLSSPSILSFTYRFEHINFQEKPGNSVARRGFWVPEDRDMIWALDRLIKNYAHNTDK